MRKLFVILVCMVFAGGCAGMAPKVGDGSAETWKTEQSGPETGHGSVDAVAPVVEGEKEFRREVVTMRDEAGEPILYFLTIYKVDTGDPAGFFILDREKKVVVGGRK